MTFPNPQRKSAVLILALLLMGAIIGSSISLSTVIVDSGRQSQDLNNFISASLNADTGIERGLAVVKVGRKNATQGATVTNITPATAIPGLTITGSVSSSNTLGWNVVRQNESVTFDIIASDAGNLNTGDNNIQLAGFGSGKLDVSWVGLDGTGVPLYSGRLIINSLASIPLTDLTSAANLRDENGAPVSGPFPIGLTRGFRIKITALDSSVTQLRASKTNGFGFPSRIEITSTGTINKSQSQKVASVLWQLPSSPAFGYVLFTEGDIIPR